MALIKINSINITKDKFSIKLDNKKGEGMWLMQKALEFTKPFNIMLNFNHIDPQGEANFWIDRGNLSMDTYRTVAYQIFNALKNGIKDPFLFGDDKNSKLILSEAKAVVFEEEFLAVSNELTTIPGNKFNPKH